MIESSRTKKPAGEQAFLYNLSSPFESIFLAGNLKEHLTNNVGETKRLLEPTMLDR